MELYYYLPFRKLGLAKVGEWGIAIRESKSYESILNKEMLKFRIIENTKEFWFADPILFSDSGKTWLFVEAYNYQTHKGEIGVFDIVDGQAVNFRIVLTMPTHMSYPFVFKSGNEYYMIPETGAAKEIVIYKADKFPDVWRREKVLLEGEIYRDNTIFKDASGKLYMITYKQEGTKRFNIKYYLTSFELDMVNLCLIQKEQFYDKKQCNRPAGPVFSHDERIYRVTQKCNRAYGESIYIYEMLGEKRCTDKIVGELRGKCIVLNDGRNPILTHTYSQAGGYEVIDFRCKK